MSARPYIGGQAVLEGVMMRAPQGVAVAVRRPDGSLVVREGPLPRGLRSRIWKLPGLRGIGALVESLSLGYSALQFSADQQEVRPGVATLLLSLVSAAESDGPAPQAEPAAGGPSAGDTSSRIAMVASTLVALALFIALPQLLAALSIWASGASIDPQDWRFHALTGTFKLLVLTGYLVGISRIPEIARVFAYHGAEHKTIFAYEAGLPLRVENVRAQSTLHPRCGTTFLVVVVIVSVVLGSIVTPLALPDATGLVGQLETLALRIGLLPLVAAVSYEIQRFSARYCTRGPLRALLLPGFLFQKITTREPDPAQIEVAIAAMRAALFRREARGDAVTVRSFDTLDGVLGHYALIDGDEVGQESA